MMRAVVSVIAIAAAIGADRAAAVEFELARVVVPTHVVLPAGQELRVAIDVIVLPGYHVQANPAAYANLIPITLTFTPAAGITVGKPVYPSPHRLRLEGSGDELLVYRGRFRIIVPLARQARDASAVRLQGTLHYQGCDHRQCLFPQSLPVVLGIAGGAP